MIHPEDLPERTCRCKWPASYNAAASCACGGTVVDTLQIEIESDATASETINIPVCEWHFNVFLRMPTSELIRLINEGAFLR